MGKNSRAKKERREALGKATEAVDLIRKHNVYVDPGSFPPDELREVRRLEALKAAINVVKPLDKERTSSALVQSARQAGASLDKELATILLEIDTADAGRVRIACKFGCNYCCTIRVTALAPEIVRCAEYVRSALSETEFSQLRARVNAHDAETATLSSEERILKARMCPLNVDGRCIAYEARPLACRAYHSFNVNVCREDAENASLERTVPMDPLRQETRALHLIGVRSGYKAMSVDTRELEFIPALGIAMDNPKTGDMLLAGQNVFADAHNLDLLASAERALPG